ncbi:ABC transporter ATP-binding protein [Promethearchaeum syntrophicum]|uniref:ABC transporter ATP-binding protein n=1 Tax=Promethearchaeum syntrophicum TaxID=2594042 RepID=A0A5B9D6J6_9ARCH|nr:ABC transporter ATP-binding protein [Candidatus Prometheoarchaeum syntrophicum]QEE14460.1 putative ABC transporter ATP-binding protein [Candidatus Prometheoarchaeum syntrophicum]
MIDIDISAINVSFRYKTSDDNILKEINLNINRGKFVLICGPTGSGKTSLIRTMNGLIPHFYRGKFYGYMKVKGKDTISSSPALLSETVGTVFQTPENQLFSMDVERELAFSLENLGFSKEKIKEKIEKVISITQIEKLRHRPPFQLSGGEQQKVAIASLLALDPDILVLDEPLSNLDPKTSFEILNLLKHLQSSLNKTIIISEHRMESVIPFVDEMIVINNGKIIQHDNAKSVFNSEIIYSLGLDLPPIIYWLKKKRDEGFFSGEILLNFEDQKQKLAEIFSKYTEIAEFKPNNITREKEIYEKNPNIFLKDISHSYEFSADHTKALENISCSIFPREIVAIMGPNGAGKSTLIKCISGLIKPNTGNIWIQGRNIKNSPTYKIAKNVGLMFQNPDHQLFLNSVLDEIKFSLKNLQLSDAEEKSRIEKTLRDLNLNDLSLLSPFNLSGGQRKKVSLATILCRNTNILIFDEPTIGQDAEHKKRMNNLILQAQNQNKTSIIVSHDLEFVANLATRIIILEKGKILADGNVEEIFTQSTILKRASLDKYNFTLLFKDLHKDFPWIPENILNIKQLEDLLSRCH